jgi:hypothetical protein
LHAENRVIEEGQRTLVERLLREKISLHGICRAVGVSIRWLMDFIVARFKAAPEDLHVQLPSRPGEVIIRRVEAEADDAQLKARTSNDRLAHRAPARSLPSRCDRVMMPLGEPSSGVP